MGSGSASQRASSASATATIETAEQAYAHLKVHRLWTLMVAICAFSFVAAGLVLVLPGDSPARHIHAGALGVSGVVTGVYAVVFRAPERYRPAVAYVVVLSLIPVTLSGYYFWGIFSAYLAAVLLTIYVAVETAESVKAAVVGTAVFVAAQSALGFATVFGWMDAPGLVAPIRGTFTTQIVAVVLVQLLTIGAALFAYESRLMTRAVLDEHDRAMRGVAQREAQIAEVQAEALDVRRAGGINAGRFTDHIIGGFKLGEILGRGSMGEVYAATREDDGARCAVKLLSPHAMHSSTAYDRFQREAAILLTLESPYVVRVLAVSHGDTLPFLAMERLVGVDLSRLLKERPVLPLSTVVEFVTHAARGLEAAHRVGVIHRDIAPKNLFGIGAENARTWKLIDFGIARWADGEGSLTKDKLIGTPAYMAPEQALGLKLTTRSDIYSLALCAYRGVTGIQAVLPSEVPKMLHEVAYKMPRRPSLVEDVPASVEAVLAIALAKEPAARFATAGELADALAEAASNRLSATLRERAARVLAKAPWGSWRR